MPPTSRSKPCLRPAATCSSFAAARKPSSSAWLRQILAHVLSHEIRRYRGTQQREIGREVSLEQSLAKSSQRLGDMLAARDRRPASRPCGTSRRSCWL